MNFPLILASASPRRRELLAAAGFQFGIAHPSVAEISSAMFSMRELTNLNATRKALAIASHHPDAVVLAADTLVALDGRVIGKPRDMKEARQILRGLRGRTHQVCTAVFACRGADGARRSFSVTSHVRFRTLSDREIARYLERIEPLDKAGAYAAQRDGGEIIAEIRGSYTNVVGLPMEETVALLHGFGLRA